LKKISILLSIALALFLFYNYQAVLGPAVAQIEVWRLRSQDHSYRENPPAASDDFSNGLSDRWTTRFINQLEAIHPGPEFGAGAFEVSEGRLFLTLKKDPAFDQKPGYNNVAWVGFQGYHPEPGRDVVARAIMQAGPGYFGSAGIVFEPVNMFQPDGTFLPGTSFNMFGVVALGPESEMYGNSGAVCSLGLNRWPSYTASLGNANISEPHEYEVRLRWVDENTWLGIISVDGVEQCRTEFPPFGPVELQLWSDNYQLYTAPWWKMGILQIEFQNGDKWFAFDSVSVQTEPAGSNTK